MYTKPHDVKVGTRTLLKNKDCRKLRDTTKQQLDVQDDILSDFIPAKGSLECVKLGNKTQAFVCKPGKRGTDSSITPGLPILIDTDTKANAIMDVYPSVFALWQFPLVLPQVLVHSNVSRFLLDGADLMAPGVVWASDDDAYNNTNASTASASSTNDVNRSSPRILGKNSEFLASTKVAIRVVGNPLPFAVGYTIQSSRECQSSGYTGRFIKIVQIYRDHLWQWGVAETMGQNSGIPNEGYQQHGVTETTECREAAEAVEMLANEMTEIHRSEDKDKSLAASMTEIQRLVDIFQNGLRSNLVTDWELARLAGVSTQWIRNIMQSEIGSSQPTNAHVASPSTSTPASTSHSEVASSTPSTSINPTDLVWSTFLQALRKSIKPAALPMRASEVWAQHILPERPEGSTISIKKSSFKKVSSLFLEARAKGIIEVAVTDTDDDADVASAFVERLRSIESKIGEQPSIELTSDRDVLWVVSVNKQHPEVRAHKPWSRTAGAAEAAIAAANHAADESELNSRSQVEDAADIPVVLEILKPSQHFVPLIEHSLSMKLQDAMHRVECGGSADTSCTISADESFVFGGLTRDEQAGDIALGDCTIPIPFGLFVGGLSGRRKDQKHAFREDTDFRPVAKALWDVNGSLKQTIEAARTRIDLDPSAINRLAAGLLLRKSDIVTILGDYVRAVGLQHPSRSDTVYVDSKLQKVVGSKAVQPLSSVPKAPRSKASVNHARAADTRVPTKADFPSLSIRVRHEPDSVHDSNDSQPTYIGVITKQTMAQQAVAGASPFHVNIFANHDLCVYRGIPPSISVCLGKIPGRKNKKTTLVQNLESWGITPQLFSRAIQKACAGRASLEPSPTGNPDKVEVMIQGDVISQVVQFLTSTLRVPQKYVKVSNVAVNRGAKAKGRA